MVLPVIGLNNIYIFPADSGRSFYRQGPDVMRRICKNGTVAECHDPHTEAHVRKRGG